MNVRNIMIFLRGDGRERERIFLSMVKLENIDLWFDG